MPGLLTSRLHTLQGAVRKERDMYSYYIPDDDDRMPHAVARSLQSRADEPLMFLRLFLVVGIFFVAIGGFHQFIG